MQTTEKPKFTHPEIEHLYINDFSFEPALIKEILSLPKATLIKDLETVLNDSIIRFNYYSKKCEDSWDEKSFSFPIHAIYLLAELKAEDSLTKVLEFLSYGYDFTDFWLSDLKTEYIWEQILYLSQNKLDELFDFVTDYHNDEYSRSAVSQAVQQMYYHNFKSETETSEWYKKVLTYIIEKDESEPVNIAFVVQQNSSDYA